MDISFDNASKEGIFCRLSENMKLPCQYIFVECKNYSSDPGNPELDQLSGRFSVNRGQVGFLVCWSFKDRQLFIQRCRDAYNDGRGVIDLLSDQDIINLLDKFNEYNYAFIDRYLSDLGREITMGWEAFYNLLVFQLFSKILLRLLIHKINITPLDSPGH